MDMALLDSCDEHRNDGENEAIVFINHFLIEAFQK